MIYEDTTGMYELMLLSEIAWNSIIEDHMKLEYSSIIYEDTKLLEDGDEGFFAKLKSFFQKLLGSLENIFRSVINNIRNLLVNNKKFVDNSRKTIQSNYSDVTVENVPASMIVTDALIEGIKNIWNGTNKNFENIINIIKKYSEESLKDGFSQGVNQELQQHDANIKELQIKINDEMANIQKYNGYTINATRCLTVCDDLLEINNLYNNNYNNRSKDVREITKEALNSCNRKEKNRIKIIKNAQRITNKMLAYDNKITLKTIEGLKKMVNYFISKAIIYKKDQGGENKKIVQNKTKKEENKK